MGDALELIWLVSDSHASRKISIIGLQPFLRVLIPRLNIVCPCAHARRWEKIRLPHPRMCLFSPSHASQQCHVETIASPLSFTLYLHFSHPRKGGSSGGAASTASPEGATGAAIAAKLAFADPHLVVRCARHYERAAAIVVSAAVVTASLFVEPPPARWGLARAVQGEEEEKEGNPTAMAAESYSENHTDGDARVVDGDGQQQRRRRQEQQEQQAKQQSERISRMNPREQAMARHSQAHASHRQVVAKNARRTQQRVQAERRRWEEQQQAREQQALPVGASVTSRAAARIDLAGGWTDTPPISYEAGGSVVNAAVTVSGQRPVEARCDRINARSVELVCEGRDGTVVSRTVCSTLQDFA